MQILIPGSFGSIISIVAHVLHVWRDCFTIALKAGHIRRLTTILLLSFLVISSLGCQAPQVSSSAAVTPSAPLPAVVGQHEYAVHLQLQLVNDGPGQPDKQNIWVALIHDFPPYQQVKSTVITPQAYQPVVDEYGNQYAEFDFARQPANSTQTITIDYQVAVNELTYDLSICQGSLPDVFKQPELHIESANPQIVSLAEQLSQGKQTTCQQVRSFYDYVSSELAYTSNGENWGAQAALGPMGSDCTEYTDLLVALSRAEGIPARYFEGLLYQGGGTAAATTAEHAWPDVYLPAVGWTALDPTLGRAAVNRETYFAHYTPDHIIVTLGASPSVLRGSSYWTHLYWPGDSTQIHVRGEWTITSIDDKGQ